MSAAGKAKTAAKAQFRIPKTASKYRPIQYDPVSFERKQHLRELDDRDQYLLARYRQLLQRDCLLFYHGVHMAPRVVQQYRHQMKLKGIGMEFINRRMMTGALLLTPFEQMAALVQGPSYAFWPSSHYQQPPGKFMDVDFNSMSVERADCVSFTRDLIQAFSKEQNMTLLGGKVESVLMAAEELREYSQLPTKSQLASSLVSTLTAPAQQLTGSLTIHPRNLIALLDLHSKSPLGQVEFQSERKHVGTCVS